MARGNSIAANGGVRKKARANHMGLQWWRKLTLPRRGKKDSLLSPAPLTAMQKERLEERATALRKATIAPRVTKHKALASAEWDNDLSMARVVATRGHAMNSMGEFRDGGQFLYPEEALYLVDRGGLDLCFDGLPASVQRTWAVTMAARNALSLEEYLAFAHLRRAGYVVRRLDKEKPSCTEAIKVSFSVWRVGSFRRRDPIRPLFHVAVFRYEDPPPSTETVATYLEAQEKTRLKFAIIDRGVVVLTDVATNATPLSERFVKRLPRAAQEQARSLQRGVLGDFITPGPHRWAWGQDKGMPSEAIQVQDDDTRVSAGMDNVIDVDDEASEGDGCKNTNFIKRTIADRGKLSSPSLDQVVE